MGGRQGKVAAMHNGYFKGETQKKQDRGKKARNAKPKTHKTHKWQNGCQWPRQQTRQKQKQQATEGLKKIK
jgi:hypothetical protein